ncbi:P-loop NTPase [Methylocystis sp. B8]|uniref:nucleotide-binding protein n=1 Tax=Methylocystis sp. B8 TaxID=544938 RepID=UPI0010FEBB09|nr:P-loop NTPase [Methylocystis sp. B8]TLG72608.1 ParA family protein [Methylocystis sp. B8]
MATATAAAVKPRPRAAALPAAVKRVALVANEKGGVGKSVFTRTLVDHLRTNGKRVAAYDADGSVGATARVLGSRDAAGAVERVQNPVEGVGYYNGRADAERNILLDSIESGEKLYVHDLAGGLLADLTRIVDGGEGLDGLLDAFEAHGYRLTLLHVISPDVGAAQSVARWLSLIGDRADHVAVINLKHGKPPNDFPFWYGFTDAKGVAKGGKTREKLLAMGGVEIEFPALPAGTFAKLDAENIPFTRADKAGLLTITERAHVTKYLRDFAAALTPAFPFLGL